VAANPYTQSALRQNLSTASFVAGGGITPIVLAGPFDEIVLSLRGTTDAHTVSILGMWRAIAQLLATSSKRGALLSNITGVHLSALSRGMFNTAAPTDSVGGAANDGWDAIIPLACDADETITIAGTWGALADMAGGDLAGYTGILRAHVRQRADGDPKTYFMYVGQDLGALGVVGVTTRVEQQALVAIDGYALVAEAIVAEVTSVATALADNTITRLEIQQGQVPLIDALTPALVIERVKAFGAASAAGYVYNPHVPLQVNAATKVAVTGGATATIAPSAIAYVYQSGVVSDRDRLAIDTPAPGTTGGTQGANAPALAVQRTVTPGRGASRPGGR